jgi:hypothetical protein
MSKAIENPFPEKGEQADEGNPTREEIALRPYQIYVERGCVDGQDMDDWLEAERELLARYRETGRKGKSGGVKGRAARSV